MKKFDNLKKDIVFLKNLSNNKAVSNNVWENRSKKFISLFLDSKEINFNFFLILDLIIKIYF